jgi:hypothetical protein
MKTLSIPILKRAPARNKTLVRNAKPSSYLAVRPGFWLAKAICNMNGLLNAAATLHNVY